MTSDIEDTAREVERIAATLEGDDRLILLEAAVFLRRFDRAES